jgi:hypothetical protein
MVEENKHNHNNEGAGVRKNLIATQCEFEEECRMVGGKVPGSNN